MIGKQVSVLFSKAGDVINNVSCRMLDHELRSVSLAGLLIMRIGCLLQIELIELSKQVLIIATSLPLIVN